jgi:hypothetical protein
LAFVVASGSAAGAAWMVAVSDVMLDFSFREVSRSAHIHHSASEHKQENSGRESAEKWR